MALFEDMGLLRSTSALPEDCRKRYAAERILGEGGSGVVWCARDLHLDRLVAVKVLTQDAQGSPDQIERLRREARIAGGLDHPNIVKLLDHGVESVPWIAYELVAGRSMRLRLEQGPFTVQDAVAVLLQVAGALEVAHASGVVHRDIKPENLLEASPNTYKLTDFGIARREQPGAPLTAPGTVLGTPDYLAPEVILGNTVTPAADLYALGVLLFEMLTGKRPFDAPSVVEKLRAHVDGPVPGPRSHSSHVPPRLDALVVQLLSKKPADRPDSAKRVVARLLECDSRRSVAVEDPTAPVKRSAPIRNESFTQKLSQRPSRPAPKGSGPRRRWPWLVAATIALGAPVAAGAIWLWRRDTEPAPSTQAPTSVDRTAELGRAERILEDHRNDLEQRWSWLDQSERSSWSAPEMSAKQLKDQAAAGLALCERSDKRRARPDALDPTDALLEARADTFAPVDQVRVSALAGRRDSFRFVDWFLCERARHWARVHRATLKYASEKDVHAGVITASGLSLELDFEPRRGEQLLRAALRSIEKALDRLPHPTRPPPELAIPILRDLALVSDSTYSSEMYWVIAEQQAADRMFVKLCEELRKRRTAPGDVSSVAASIVDLRRGRHDAAAVNRVRLEIGRLFQQAPDEPSLASLTHHRSAIEKPRRRP